MTQRVSHKGTLFLFSAGYPSHPIGHLNAEKIDIGETGWKVLSPRMFVNTYIGEVVLPKNLEVIPGDSFSDTVINKELILPNTLKVVGDAAFDNGQMSDTTSHQALGTPGTYTAYAKYNHPFLGDAVHRLIT